MDRVGSLEEGLEGLDLAVGAAAVPVTRLVLHHQWSSGEKVFIYKNIFLVF